MNYTKENNKLMRYIIDLMHECGIPSHLSGYDFLIDSIFIVLNKNDAVRKITTFLYPSIAQKNNTTSMCVEKNIRHAIQTGWDRVNVEFSDKLFRNTISQDRGNPTNQEFISTLAEYIQLNYMDGE